MNDAGNIYRVRPPFAWSYRAMGVFSLIVSFFSLRFLNVLFEMIQLSGPIPVPNIPLIIISALFILQSLALVFVAVYFFVRAELRLAVSPTHLSVLSYWYEMVTPWENVRCLTQSPVSGIPLPVLILQSPGVLETRKQRKGLYSLSREVIPVGLFSPLTSGDEVTLTIQRYAPHLLEKRPDAAW